VINGSSALMDCVGDSLGGTIAGGIIDEIDMASREALDLSLQRSQASEGHLLGAVMNDDHRDLHRGASGMSLSRDGPRDHEIAKQKSEPVRRILRVFLVSVHEWRHLTNDGIE
jgi:hypothetical protein